MSRTSFSEFRNLPDPFLTYNWDFVIPNVPNGGSSTDLRIRCAEVMLPGMEINWVGIELHGYKSFSAGAQTWTNRMQVVFLETRDLKVRNQIENWIKYARDTRQNTGTSKAAYSTTAQLILYNDVPAVARTVYMDAWWPMNLQDAQLSGSAQGGPLYVTVEGSFDAAYEK